jgi:hypothetical protein
MVARMSCDAMTHNGILMPFSSETCDFRRSESNGDDDMTARVIAGTRIHALAAQ